MYYALAKGAWKGLKGWPPNWAIRQADKLIKEYYLTPMREQLNKPILDLFQPVHTLEEETAVYE